jgi:hypothetical protein
VDGGADPRRIKGFRDIPEVELLLAAACLQPDRELIRAIADRSPDWEKFEGLAVRHGLRPLAYRALENSQVAAPSGMLARLWAAHVRRDHINRTLLAELQRIATAFEANDIACIPFKGPTLALLAYGDLALREFGDLDILVAPWQVDAARDALEALGYVRQFEIPDDAERSMRRSHMHYDLPMRAPSGAIVELHWRTDPDFPVERDEKTWWSSLARRDFASMPLRCFDATDLVLVLLLHGSKHHWESLHWLADVTELSRRESIDWNRLQQRAAALGASRRVDLGLLLARELFDAPVPEVRAHSAVEALALELAEQAFAPEVVPGPSRLLARNLVLFERHRDRVRHVMAVLFEPTFADWMRWRLPRPLFFLYMPLRIARLAAKHARLAITAPHLHSRIAAMPRTPPRPPRSTG